MKHIGVVVCMVLLVFAVAVQGQPPVQQKSGSVEQELMRIERDWAAADVKRDAASLDRILAQDWLDTDEKGGMGTKAEYLADLKSGEYVVTYGLPEDMRVRVYGDAAVVTGRWTEKSTRKGRDTSSVTRYTDVYVKLEGRWQCVASHESNIAQ